MKKTIFLLLLISFWLVGACSQKSKVNDGLIQSDGGLELVFLLDGDIPDKHATKEKKTVVDNRVMDKNKTIDRVSIDRHTSIDTGRDIVITKDTHKQEILVDTFDGGVKDTFVPEPKKEPEPIIEIAPEPSNIPPCQGSNCPIVITKFPYHDNRNTTQSTLKRFNRYNCAPTKREDGAEYIYVFELKQAGSLIAMIADSSKVDIDIHLLRKLDANTCLIRHDKGISFHLQAGVYYLAADTYTSSSGSQKPGQYDIYVHFLPDTGKCGMKHQSISRIGTSSLLPMPFTAPVVREAHLVTLEEQQAHVFPSGWPTSIHDGIKNHYRLSEKISGYKMNRSEPWAPCCEPSNHYGQGSRPQKPPMLAETWYINMRWRHTPPAGTRYIIFNGINGKAVVAAAGYENGPGNLTRVGGASEEIHHYLNTKHLSVFTFGESVNQQYKYGPINCYK